MISFDVFDTLVRRKCIYPEGIFEIMQQKLNSNTEVGLSRDVIDDFADLRIGAESVARKTYCRYGIQEVSLEQIYEVLVKSHHISDTDAQYLCSMERETEYEEAEPIADNIDSIIKYVEEGNRVVLISDMYLDEGTIRRILVKLNPFLGNIKLYVSSDKPFKNKWSGDLFKYVKECEAVEYCEWIHIGDNYHSDYEVPTFLGIECHYYKDESKADTKQENKVKDVYYERDNLPYQIGMYLGGPVLIPYAKWIVTKCKDEGIKRLYFIARDGYLIKKIVDAVISEEKLDVQTAYIYGSRVAWRIPNPNCIIEGVWKSFCHSYEDRIFNHRQLAAFFRIGAEELAEYLPPKLTDANKVWPRYVTEMVVRFLLENASFVNRLSILYSDKRSLVKNYLIQNVDSSDPNFAFVDLAGSGLTMENVADIAQYQSAKVFYYRMDSAYSDRCDNYVFYPYYVDYFVMLEMFCRAPQGQTVDYSMLDDGRIAPVFNDVDKTAISEYGIEEYYKGVMDYNHSSCKDECVLLRSDIAKVLERIYCTPTQEEMKYFSNIPNMLTGRECELSVFAPKLSDEDIENIYRNRRLINKEYYYRGSDFEYSLKQCTKKQKQRIEALLLDENPIGTLNTLVDFSVLDILGDNVIIYGAGRRGTRLIHLLCDESMAHIVAVIDKDTTKRIDDIRVTSIKEVRNLQFDQVIITIADRSIAKMVELELVELGVEKQKILFY